MEISENQSTADAAIGQSSSDPDLIALKALEDQMVELERDIERVDRSPPA